MEYLLESLLLSSCNPWEYSGKESLPRHCRLNLLNAMIAIVLLKSCLTPLLPLHLSIRVGNLSEKALKGLYEGSLLSYPRTFIVRLLISASVHGN